MIKKVNIKSIEVKDRDKNDKILVNKSGNNYKMAYLETECGITATHYLDEKFGASALRKVQDWREGDAIEIAIEKNGEYTNFKIPGKMDYLEERVRFLENELLGSSGEHVKVASKGEPVAPEKEITPEDLPF